MALQRLADEKATGPWQILMLPFSAGEQPQRARLYLPRDGGGTGEEAGDEKARFIFEVETTRLGRVQFDGRIREKRFDLLLRSPAAAFGPAARAEIERLFHTSIAASGWAGEIAFSVQPAFPAPPLAAVTLRLGLSA
jgi:hypothetical protein